MNNPTLTHAYASPGSVSYPSGIGSSSLQRPSTRPYWAAIGVLSVCVIAMGSSLVQMSNSKLETLAHAGLPLSSAQAMVSPSQMQGLLTTSIEGSGGTTKNEAKQQFAPVKSSSNATKKVANATPAAGPAVASSTQASCSNCGTVEAVTPITRDGQGTGIGAVTGGVIGGVVGNQIGNGSGRAVATVLGAVGGGWAGHTVEKKMKKETVYSVRVRMQDGSRRTVQQQSAPAVGSKVSVDGTSLRPA